MDPYSSPYIIPNSNPHNPFPHSLQRTLVVILKGTLKGTLIVILKGTLKGTLIVILNGTLKGTLIDRTCSATLGSPGPSVAAGASSDFWSRPYDLGLGFRVLGLGFRV